jgi:hypothetical protein
MELLVATWTVRLALIAALAVGIVSYQSGAAVIDAMDRALAVAVGFTFAGKFLVGWLEPPEKKMLRMRKRRAAKRTKKSGTPTDSVAAAAKARRESALSRDA